MVYQFGDGTRLGRRALHGFIGHMKAHHGAIAWRVDWVKVGRSLVDYLALHGIVSLGIVLTTIKAAAKDRKSAQDWAAIATGVVGVANLIRRIVAGGVPLLDPHKLTNEESRRGV